MEKAIHRFKNPLLLIVVGLAVIAALAAGIYFLFINKEKEPTRGTYVITQFEREHLL